MSKRIPHLDALHVCGRFSYLAMQSVKIGNIGISSIKLVFLREFES